MPVQAQDIKFYLTGGVANNNPNASLGGARSNTQIGSGLNNLYDNITGTNHSLGNVDTSQLKDYRIFAMRLDDPLADASNSTLDNAVLKVASQSLGDCAIKAAIASAVNTTIPTIANENTAPTQDSLMAPLSFQTIPGGGLSLPTSIQKGQSVHIAIERTITAGTTPATNSITLQIQGDTV